MKLFLTVALGLNLASVALAQTSSQVRDQLPPGPLIKPLPDFYQWTVTTRGESGGGISTAEKGGAKQAPPKQVVGRKTGDIRQIVTSFGNGDRTVFWKKGGLQYVMSEGNQLPIIGPASQDEIYGDLNWVSAANFEGISAVGGRKCMVFRDMIDPPGLIDLDSGISKASQIAKIKAVACIDLELRFPVVVQLGDEITTYKFEPIQPQVPMQLPPEVQMAFATQIQAERAAIRKPVRP
jgi:hypothetical protein